MFQIIDKWLAINTSDFHQETSCRLHKWLLVNGFRTYPGSRGPFSKYLIWNKPCLRFDKAPEFFFLSALRASLTRLRREPSVSVRKQYPLEPRVSRTHRLFRPVHTMWLYSKTASIKLNFLENVKWSELSRETSQAKNVKFEHNLHSFYYLLL